MLQRNGFGRYISWRLKRTARSQTFFAKNPGRQTLILDPCCGSGAFLINCLLHVAGEISGGSYTPRQISKYIFDFAHDKLWGFDASKQMASVARIAMIMSDDGRAHVFHHDSLVPREAGPEQAKAKKFKLILTNPPFGKRIAAKSSILEYFELAKRRASPIA
jgi:type I restriction enzyme M protein